MQEYERLGRLAVEYLASQLEEKRRNRQWAEVNVKVVIQDGEPTKAELTDFQTVKPKDLDRKAAE